ncbi:filamentous hemagglutinin [Azospira oryzae]|uniref:Filamentous hemagglutinin n=1 Tax=Azospira oryzae TaxID=146939 RepID=A0ABY0INR5_9RHOO|nr:filamentous hemagglutinin N-terminal domain-containing protein [Azospira oryzae]RZT76340.1 filamentous hemagglutinin [Azospira oryzae]
MSRRHKSSESPVDIHSSRQRFSAAALAAWLCLSPTGLVFAGPIADASAPTNLKPDVGTTPSGIPIVNIATPNGAGISHNRYQRFDVDPVGLLLNNSKTTVTSALGGSIAGNPNLTNGTASLILNEVVSAIPSQLNGPLAVVGDSAKVIVANPNGVTCNGCGFINTSHVTLTTGTPSYRDALGAGTAFDTATALAFQINGGRIEITGQGLAATIDRLDMVAQTLNINAPVGVSGALNLLAGRQTVDRQTLTILGVDPANTKAAIGQDWAIDGSLLGAMNAGSIKLVSTAGGMGVRTDGRLAATAGDLLISASGDVVVRQATATRDVDVYAQGGVTNQEQLAAGRDLWLDAASLDNRGAHVSAGRDGVVMALGLDNSAGKIQAGAQLAMVMPGVTLDLSAPTTGILAGGSGLSIEAQRIQNSGTFNHGSALTLEAVDGIDNTGTLSSGGTMVLSVGNASGSFSNSGSVLSLGQLGIVAANGSNASSATIEAAGYLELLFTQFDNQGKVLGRADLNGIFGTLTNSGTIQAITDAVLSLGSGSHNGGGKLLAGQDLSLATSINGDLGGEVGAGRDLYLAFADYTNGTGETRFDAGRDLLISANSFTNADTLEAVRDLQIQTAGNLTNQGLILAKQDVTMVVGGALSNQKATVEAGRDITLEAASLENTAGSKTERYVAHSLSGYVNNVLTYVNDPLSQLKLLGEASPDWMWKNSRVTLNNRNSLHLDSGLESPIFYLDITRQDSPGTFSAGRDLNVLVSGLLSNQASLMTAGRDVYIDAGELRNIAGKTVFYGNVWAGGGSHEMKAYLNASATIQAPGIVGITAPTQTNSGLIQGGGIYLGGNLTNGITDYNVQTPATRLPDSVINLGSQGLPAGATFTPDATTLFSSGARLSLLAPVGGQTLNNLLPAELRNTALPFLFDARLEQQALRDAALRETGQTLFLVGLGYDAETGKSAEEQQRAKLIDAAGRFALAEGIKLGVALTEAQQAKLTEPILWYVEESITGPDGKVYTALVPRVYLPQSTRESLVNVAGGMVRGGEVVIDADKGAVTNSGYILAEGDLTITAGKLINQKRSAYWGRYTEDMEGGYLEVWGDKVQPGGFIGAANLKLNVDRITSIAGEFESGGKDISADLAKQMGSKFTYQSTKDNTFTKFHADSSAKYKQLAALAVSVAISFWVGPQVNALVGSGGLANTMVASSLTAMASNAGSQLILTGSIDAGSLIKSGLMAGLSAGLTNGKFFDGKSLNQIAGVQDIAGTGTKLAKFDFSTLPDNLIGIGGRALVSAGIGQLVYGQDAGSFGSALLNSTVNDLAAIAANGIGQKWGGGAPGIQTVAHGVLGAVSASLKGQDSASGAIGAVSESIIGNLIDLPIDPSTGSYTTTSQAVYVGLTTLIGGILADKSGGDGAVAALAAQNAAINNRLTEAQREAYAIARKEAGCFTGAALNCQLLSLKASALSFTQFTLGRAIDWNNENDVLLLQRNFESLVSANNKLVEARENTADFAATVNRGSGIVASTAGAVSAVPGPHQPEAIFLQGGATVIGFGSMVVEQLLRPNIGQLTLDAGGTFIGTALERSLYGRMLSPVSNEMVDFFKSSKFGVEFKDYLNKVLK